MVLLKILALYFPEKFLTIGAPDSLIACARDIQLKEIDLDPKNSIQINYECKKRLSALSELKDWPYEKLGVFIWKNYSDGLKRNYYVIGSKYGGKADMDIFPDIFKQSIIATGFASHLNLKNYYGKKQNEIVEYLGISK